MQKYLEKLPKETSSIIRLASDMASRGNISAYLVGGFVRDLILGIKNLDLDIVVEGDGIKFAQDLASLLNARVIRHSRFGTATILIKHNQKVDITSARKESYPEPASLPLVARGTLEDDLGRRDFTINAMAISITGTNSGKLIDFFGGEADLKNKKIRILHNLSFIDDPTRILRAIRFEQRYNFKIEPQTLVRLKEAARLEMLEKVGPQRLRDELILILKEEHPIKPIKRIDNLVGFNFISRDIALSGRTYKLLRSIEAQIKRFKKTYHQRREIDTWLIYLMGLLDNLSINEVKNICEKFVFRKGEGKRILSYKNINRKFISEFSQNKIKPSRIFILLEPLSYEVIILLKTKYKNRNICKHVDDFLEIYNGMRLLISGEDLHKLGVVPGPYYQEVFAQVLKAKLEGLVKTKAEELALIKKVIHNK